MSHPVKCLHLKIQHGMMFLSIIAVGLLAHCSDEISPSVSSDTGRLTGRAFVTHLGAQSRLMAAVFSIGGQTSTTNTGGNFAFSNLPLGLQVLSIFHPNYGSIDTIIDISQSTTIDFTLQIHALGGGVYRYLLPTEPLRDDSLGDFLMVRKPIRADVSIDGQFRFSTSANFECNLPIVFFLFPGSHRFQITSAETYPLDTAVDVNREGTCDTGGYNFTLTPLPVQVDSIFNYPLGIGTRSVYQYNYNSYWAGSITKQTTRIGEHQWTIVELSAQNQDSVYRCSVFERDSVRVVRRDISGVLSDTSYIDSTLSEFQITVTPDSIVSNWPARAASDRRLHAIPRRFLGTSNTITIYAGPAQAIYESGFGLWSFRYFASGNNYVDEKLELLEVIR